MKVEIQNISFITYSNLEDKSKYDYLLRYAKFEYENIFSLKPLADNTFGHVKNVQELLNYTGLTWEMFFQLISEEKGITIKAVAENSLFDLHRQRLWLKNEVEEINKLENSIGSGVTKLQEAAGIERFNKYRSFLVLDNLAGGDITKYEEIKGTPYWTCFVKLRLEAERNDYQEKYNELLKPKK